MSTEDELRRGAGFIGYEYLMLAEATRRWTDQRLRKHSRATKFERRMITDVSLLHTRNLVDFLAQAGPPRARKVLATHYNPSWRWPEGRQLAGRGIAYWRRQINNLLSHVTYERIALMSKRSPWPLEAIHSDLEASLADFLKTLPESRRKWFGPEVRRDSES